MIMLLTIAMLMAIVTVHPITRLLIVAMALSITMLMATVTIHPVTRLLIVAMALLPVTLLLSIAMLRAIITIHSITGLLTIAVTLLSVTWLTVITLVTITLLLTIAMLMAAITVHPITWLLTVALTLLPVTWLVPVALLLAIALLVAVTLRQTVEIGLPKPQEVLAVAEDAGPRWTEGRVGPAWGGLVMQPDCKVLLPASVQQKLEPGVQFLSPGHASLVLRLEDALLFDVVSLALFAVPRNEADPAAAGRFPGLCDVNAAASQALGLPHEGPPVKPAAAADSVRADDLVGRHPLLVVLVGRRLFLLVLQEREDARVVHVRLMRIQVLVRS